ncbi:MAG TPA: HAMP domain-containing sensor histidine kinase [Acidimicrobiia bacterium]|nr:HAMP domain-containing sensor histidine kinase [Acidimicrobiia bacterium]
MRRRIFWTIAGVAAVTGVLVLAAAVFSSQRAAIDATYRELEVSAKEAVTIIDDYLAGGADRPGAALEFLRLLEGDQLGPLFGRIRRTAGGSEIAFGLIDQEGVLRTNAPLFERVDIVGEPLNEGETTETTSTTGELVVVTPTAVDVRGNQLVLLVGLAREAPIVSLGDQGLGLLLLFAGIVVLAGAAARLLADQLANRLEPLADASRQVAAGDMTARVPEVGDADLDQVGAAFNDMASELESTREREREFILGVGHDLRTPLTTIGGYAEAMEAGVMDPEELARIGSVLGVQSRQLGRLIEDLTTLAGLEGAEFSLRNESVDVGAHVAEVVEGFRMRADELGVGLVVDVEERVVIDTDPDRLGQIAQNLVENALRHTPETGTVRVTVGRGSDGVEIVVADSGIGIPADDLPHVFDRHFVGRQRTVHKEGTGLGLSIVKGLVDRMHGSVAATSAPGKGTTITVTLS